MRDEQTPPIPPPQTSSLQCDFSSPFFPLNLHSCQQSLLIILFFRIFAKVVIIQLDLLTCNIPADINVLCCASSLSVCPDPSSRFGLMFYDDSSETDKHTKSPVSWVLIGFQSFHQKVTSQLRCQRPRKNYQANQMYSLYVVIHWSSYSGTRNYKYKNEILTECFL